MYRESGMKRVITYSGAVYYIDGDKVTGGSKNLKDGRLIGPLRMGSCLLIDTPERAQANPTAIQPAVRSSVVIAMEDVDE
jgi:hypothetical protein